MFKRKYFLDAFQVFLEYFRKNHNYQNYEFGIPVKINHIELSIAYCYLYFQIIWSSSRINSKQSHYSYSVVSQISGPLAASLSI